MDNKTIRVWRWEDAPTEFQLFGDGAVVAFIPDALRNEYFSFLEFLGCCYVSDHVVHGGLVKIGAHSELLKTAGAEPILLTH